MQRIPQRLVKQTMSQIWIGFMCRNAHVTMMQLYYATTLHLGLADIIVALMLEIMSMRLSQGNSATSVASTIHVILPNTSHIIVTS